MKKLTPKGIQINIKVHSKGPACVVNTDNKYARASVEAMHEVFGKDTVYIRSGGSIPIVTQFDKDLKIPSIMMGMGLPDDNLHAPEREVPYPELPPRDRVDYSLLPDTGGGKVDGQLATGSGGGRAEALPLFLAALVIGGLAALG